MYLSRKTRSSNLLFFFVISSLVAIYTPALIALVAVPTDELTVVAAATSTDYGLFAHTLTVNGLGISSAPHLNW